MSWLDLSRWRLLPSVLIRTLPIAIAGLALIYALEEWVAERVVKNQLSRDLERQVDYAAQINEERLANILAAARALAANDLLVNSLVDVDAREAYVPTFFQSLRIAGPAGVRVSLTDYRGRLIATNRDGTGYAHDEFTDQVMSGQEYRSFAIDGITFAVPVVYDGNAEGMVVFEYLQPYVADVFSLPAGSEAAYVVAQGRVLASRLAGLTVPGEADPGSAVEGWVQRRTPLAAFPEVTVGIAQAERTAFFLADTLRSISLAALVFAILVTALGLFFAVYLATRPLRQFAEQIGEIGVDGNLDHEVTVDRPAEFADLSRAFNGMIERLKGTTVSNQQLLVEVNERRKAEEGLRTSNDQLEEANESLRRFAYVASHDLQEPLRKMQQFSDFLVSDCGDELSDDGRYFVGVIARSARRMSQLIKDLLSYSRASNTGVNRVAVDLNEVVEQLRTEFEVMIAETGAQLEFGDLPTLEGDPIMVEQLLRNLIGNAIKYRRTGTPPIVRVTAGAPSGAVAGGWDIVVEDNGIGFEDQYAQQIFEPFRRLHTAAQYPGSGIGLAVCKTICERHGWRIDVRSTPGKGTSFTVVVPHPDRGIEEVAA